MMGWERNPFNPKNAQQPSQPAAPKMDAYRPTGWTTTPDTSYSQPGYATTQRNNGPVRSMKSDNDGNWAYKAYQDRPQPFTARYRNFDGSTSDQPNYGLRDAFIHQANTAMMPYYSGQAQGAPQFNLDALLARAKDMVQGGWSNPFAQQAPQQQPLADYLGSYAPPSAYQPPPPPQRMAPPEAVPGTAEEALAPLYAPPGAAQPIPPQPAGTPYGFDRQKYIDSLNDRYGAGRWAF